MMYVTYMYSLNLTPSAYYYQFRNISILLVTLLPQIGIKVDLVVTLECTRNNLLGAKITDQCNLSCSTRAKWSSFSWMFLVWYACKDTTKTYHGRNL